MAGTGSSKKKLLKCRKEESKAFEFRPPETFSGAIELDSDELDSDELDSEMSAWDVAIRYHEFKSRPSMKPLAKKLRSLSAQAVLARAQEVLGSVVTPMERHTAPWGELPSDATQAELDLEETLDNSAGIEPKELWMEYRTHRMQSLVLSVDTSLSMTGEKLALTAVALAVVLLQFPNDPIGIVAFENEATVLKDPFEKIGIQELIERFLDVPAQGYTHLEEGMKMTLKLIDSVRTGGRAKAASAVLLTDGKYTAGKDPSYLAGKFQHLVVLKMGKEQSSKGLCKEIAHKGGGVLWEVAELEALPQTMYSVVKDLLRGKSA